MTAKDAVEALLIKDPTNPILKVSESVWVDVCVCVCVCVLNGSVSVLNEGNVKECRQMCVDFQIAVVHQTLVPLSSL